MGASEECDVTECHRPATWWITYWVRRVGYCDYHQRPIRNPPKKPYWKK